MQKIKVEPDLPAPQEIDEEVYKKWKPFYLILNDFAVQVNKNDNSKKSEQKAKTIDKLLKEVFEVQLANALYVNNIQTKAVTDSQLSILYDHMGYSCIEGIMRLLFRLIQNTAGRIDLFFFKELIAIILKHLRLNDGKPYSYIVSEFFSLLIDLNRTQNAYLSHGQDRSLLPNDIRQFRHYSVKINQLGSVEYRLNDIQVPLTSLKMIRLYYVQLLEVLTEFIEPVQDLSSAYAEAIHNLIELNLACSTREMDNALVSFVTNRFFVFDCKNVHLQKYFQFVCSITDRCSALPNCDTQQLDSLWVSFFKNLDSLNAEDKRIQLMCYLVENSINLYPCRNEHFLQFILPTALFKVFDVQFDSQLLDDRSRSIYQRLVMRVLDFYIIHLAESCLQSDQWCRLIKCLLKQDFYAPLDSGPQQVFNTTNCNYLFKFWDFLSQYASDDFLFSAPNHLLKSINYANALLPCLLYIDLKDENNFPKFFDFAVLNKIINTLLLEFSKPEPTIEESKDALIEHIYMVAHNFVRLSKQLNDESRSSHELTADQMAVFYRPWHEAKIKFVKEHPEVMNRLSRRAFARSEKVLRICLSAIGELPVIEYDNQVDFFDHILKNEFNELRQLVQSVFVSYMIVAFNNLSEVGVFRGWLMFMIEKKDERKFIASVLGKLACILHKDCGMTYEAVDSGSVEIDFKLTCSSCEKLFDTEPLNENLDLELINLVRQKFNSYLTLDDLENFNVLVRESSERFFNHVDIDEELKQNVLNLFNIADPEAQQSFDLLLSNMFRPLKVQKESFFKSFSERFFDRRIVDQAIQVRTAKFENIALMCNHFPKYQLPIVIYLLKNGILYNRDFYFNTSIILRDIVFGYDQNALVAYYVKNSNRICEEMLREILEQDVKDNQTAFDWIRKLTLSFVEYNNDFLHLFVHSFQVILPFFVRYRNTRSERILKHILDNVTFNTPENLVLQYFDPLILYFARNMTVDEIKSSFDYIDSLLCVEIRRLFRRKGPILYPLLYEYSEQTKSKNYLLSILSSQDGLDDEAHTDSKPFVDFNADADALRAYLTENLGGYLTNLNTQFLNLYDPGRNPTIAFKTLLLKSLNFIIKTVRPQTISSYFEKLMAILRVALKNQSAEDEDYKDYVYYLLSVWDTLISECEKKDLTKNLSLICKNLIDFLDSEPAGATKVLSKLIIDNELIMRNSLKELHFIPRNNRLMNPVLHVILKYVFKMPETGDIKGFEKVLKDLEWCLQVENPEIKYFHYKALLQVLSKNEQCLRSFYSSGNDLRVQPIISRLMHRMIADSKMDDQNLRIIIGECLGEFGAIDPGRLDLSHSEGQKSISRFLYTSIEDSSFAVLIIEKLVACFDLVNESKFQDCINYALQELLKIYKVKQSTSDEIWKAIQPRCQSICQQLFNTKFCVKEEICSPSHPVYKESREFSDWISKWCIAIVDKINDKFAKSVFASLKPLMNCNASIAEYLLPFLIMVVLMDNNRQDTEQIYEEIAYLIKHCLPGSSSSQQPLEVEMADQENRDEVTSVRNQQQQITVLYETNSDQYHCVHALFTLFDFLTGWCKQTKNQFCVQKKLASTRQRQVSVASVSLAKVPSYKMFNLVNDFLAKISKSELSILAASCQSYDRALMYLEEYVYENKSELANNYDNLQRLYVALEEPDGVDGIIVCRKEEPSLLNSILSHEVNGELQEAISCCEKANRIYPSEMNYSKIYLRCLLLLGHENTAKIFATNLIDQRQDCLNDLQPFIVEAAWKMGDWDDLEKELAKLSSSVAKFEVGIGSLFNVIKNNNDRQAFDAMMKDLRLIETSQISVASAGNRAYTRNYPNLVRLHMLNEVEHFYKNNYVNQRSNKERITQLTKRFTMRTKIVQTSVRLKEPLINLQRVLLSICSSNQNSRNESELAELWLSSAKLARKSNNFQSAYNFLLEIQILEQKGLERVQARETSASFTKDLRAKIIIEKAKYHWQKDTLEDKEKAVKELYRGIEQLNLQMDESNFRNLKNCLTFAKLHLLYNNYSERTLNLDSETLKNNYVAITTCYSQWEESHYNLGIYFDSLAKSVEQPHEKAEFLDKVIKNLGESLKYGSKHVYESMPKLLTAWCDLGDFKVALSKAKPSSAKGKKQQEEHEMAILDKYCLSASRTIKQFLSTIAPYNFYTAISQLTSRMCHPLNNISELIAEIITKLVIQYPHQTIWLILSSLLSENQVRKEKFTRMIGKITQHYSLVQNYITFGTILCKICNYEIGDSRNSFNLDEQFPNLKKQLDHARVNNLQVLVPFQSFMSVQLPNANRDDEQQQSLSLKNNLVFIQEFNQTVILLRSMVKPKKITIKGSDGQTYTMMCKPRDDLRKDNRTMEFNNLVNRHLRKDSETRKRNLFIKTYTVVPLRHDCGLIEWINDLQGYRDTVMGTYTKEIDDWKYSSEKIAKIYPKKDCSVAESVKVFTEKLLKLFPPIYHRWFLNQFENPTAWYNARLNFVRSCAVMSIVGYIIGLGDRHGENILINLKTGILVHVDFNCIFNKGAELEVPEVVPFRLTHNMIDAMGPTGYEGVFRKTCESTLRVMREQREALMSVLTTFVHDPLIEWNRKRTISSRRNAENEMGEATNKTALENLDRIRYRLNGLLGLDTKKDDEDRSLSRSMINKTLMLNQTNNLKIPISVNYQVQHLIEEATNPERLAVMFIGWNSFL